LIRWQVWAAIAGSVAAGLILVALVSPYSVVRAVLHSPAGLSLFGRILVVYKPLYDLTGDRLLSLAAGILFTNSLTVGIVLAVPLALYATHTLGLKLKNRVRPAIAKLLLSYRTSWRAAQIGMLYTSLYLAVFTGFSIAAVVTAVKPAIFMVPETLYVALTSSVVYSAARLPYDGFTPRYLDLLKKALPAILVLMVASAAVEAYEII
jgi:hypothetical protein